MKAHPSASHTNNNTPHNEFEHQSFVATYNNNRLCFVDVHTMYGEHMIYLHIRVPLQNTVKNIAEQNSHI